MLKENDEQPSKPNGMTVEEWQRILDEAAYALRWARALEGTPPTTSITGGDVKSEKRIRKIIKGDIEKLLES